MAGAFVPLNLSTAASGPPPGPGQAPVAAFRPARPSNSPLHSSGCEPGLGHPLVTVRKDGDRVVAIHIQCPCGQVIDLDCES